MDVQAIILELMALETYFEQGRQRAYSLRKQLESVYSPAPSGEHKGLSQAQKADLVNERMKVFYNKKGSKK